MSTRPVPRRESPWGLPEGDTRQPKAHRCNDRAEDVIQACFEGNPFKTVPGPFKLFWRCMRSNPGVLADTNVVRTEDTRHLSNFQFTPNKGAYCEEPTEPFYHLDFDPPKREEAKLD